MNTPSWRNDKHDVAVMYPTASLQEQVGAWAGQCGGASVRTSSPTTPSSLRRELVGRPLTLLDATEHPAEAREALAQVVEDLGRDSVAVYTEQMHEGLEVFVRMQGVLLFLGPMGPEEWQEAMSTMQRRHESNLGQQQPWLRLVHWPESA